jgi:hypothetical protein
LQGRTKGDAVDDSKQSRYDSERLIQVATIANEISRASGLSSHGVIKRLVMAVESGAGALFGMARDHG